MVEIVRNTSLGTRQKCELILEEMDTISREILSRFHQSSTTNAEDDHHHHHLDMENLFDMLIERQDFLTEQILLIRQHQQLEEQLQFKRELISKCENALLCLQTYLLQAVQVLSSAVHQAHEKLINIRQAKSFSSESIIRYAHQLATCYSTTAPENWQQGDIRRPYPTNIQMRQGLLARISEQTLQEQQTQQINVPNSTTVVDSSIPQTTTSAYSMSTANVRPPKHDTTSFASDIFAGMVDQRNNANLSSSDTDSDEEFL